MNMVSTRCVAVAEAAARPPLLPKREENIFRCIEKSGASKLAIVKLVKELTGLGLKEAKDPKCSSFCN